MRRVILGSMLSLSLLSAGTATLIKDKDGLINLAKTDITVVKPYLGYIKYDSDSSKSIKDSGMLGGIYISNGTLDHLYEFDVGYTNIKYKSATGLSDIRQLDTTLAYSKFYTNYMFKGGIHYINSTDTSLGNGITLIGAVGGYKWKGYDKYSYGLESYYTLYTDAQNSTGGTQKVNLFQFTPYFSYSKAINLNTRNNFDIRVNYIIANDYNTKSYTSLHISDSILYKKFIFTAKIFVGEMKTAILDGGHTAYNTKDLIKNGFALKMGYVIKPNMLVDIGYASNTIEEDGLTTEGTNSIITASLNYSF
ncbi:MAG: hypothetical protein QM493_09005 [Sulfurovum sp.]